MKELYERVYELEKIVSSSKIMTNDVVKAWDLLKIYKEVLRDLKLVDYYNSYVANKGG